MRIEKILNNNLVSSIDDKGRELVIMGKGIGFGNKAGQELDDSRIEKIFKLNSNDDSKHFQDIVEDMPIEYLRLTNEIISYAKKSIDVDLSRSIYITLTDHINFAIERHKKNLDFTNKLKWEIERFYPKEFEVGIMGLKIINDEIGIELVEDEAASIAMHIVNAELGSTNMEETLNVTKVIQGCMNIVKYHYGIELDEKSLNYSRFVTHLKFFAQRLFSGKSYDCEDSQDEELCNMIKRQYAEAHKCAERISTFIKKEFNYDLAEEELMYLTVHIKRITTHK